jgi:hypothetical protein
MVITAIAKGFILSEEAYLRNNFWYKLDFIVVCASCWRLANNTDGVKPLICLRLLRLLSFHAESDSLYRTLCGTLLQFLKILIYIALVNYFGGGGGNKRGIIIKYIIL